MQKCKNKKIKNKNWPDNPIKVHPLPNSVYPVSDSILNRTRFGIKSDSLPREPKESESHEHDFDGIGPALARGVYLVVMKSCGHVGAVLPTRSAEKKIDLGRARRMVSWATFA
jgi:hypothetical protein